MTQSSKKTFRVVLAPKERERGWTATTYVDVAARKQAAGEAMRRLQLTSTDTRVLRVEPA